MALNLSLMERNLHKAGLSGSFCANISMGANISYSTILNLNLPTCIASAHISIFTDIAFFHAIAEQAPRHHHNEG